MAVFAALLDSRSALAALRRTLPASAAPVLACRGMMGLRRAIDGNVCEAVVLGPRASGEGNLTRLRGAFPAVPLLIYGACRPELASTMVQWHALGVTALAVEGVDDAFIGTMVWRHSLSAQRRRALGDAPRLLRLTTALQRDVWDRLLTASKPSLRVTELADTLSRSREYLSRQFGAGGAPNLKRVIDLARVARAAQLLANPGYPVPRVAALLGFSTPSHLGAMARRIAGVPAAGLAQLGPTGVLASFAHGKTRSHH